MVTPSDSMTQLMVLWSRIHLRIWPTLLNYYPSCILTTLRTSTRHKRSSPQPLYRTCTLQHLSATRQYGRQRAPRSDAQHRLPNHVRRYSGARQVLAVQSSLFSRSDWYLAGRICYYRDTDLFPARSSTSELLRCFACPPRFAIASTTLLSIYKANNYTTTTSMTGIVSM